MLSAMLRTTWLIFHSSSGDRIEIGFNHSDFEQMTGLEGMHSYFWLTSSRLREPVQDDVPYTTQALKEDLLRLRNAWRDFQESRHRDAVYDYLSAVFDLVAWWTADGRALDRARWALRLRNIDPSDRDEWMIYGANGYTGRLVAVEASREGLRPVLAGRRAGPIETLAAELSLPAWVFDLGNARSAAAGVADMAVVAHCAGPFAATSA